MLSYYSLLWSGMPSSFWRLMLVDILLRFADFASLLYLTKVTLRFTICYYAVLSSGCCLSKVTWDKMLLVVWVNFDLKIQILCFEDACKWISKEAKKRKKALAVFHYLSLSIMNLPSIYSSFSTSKSSVMKS